MRSIRFVPSLVRGIVALAMTILTIALFVVAPAQMHVRDTPPLLTALNARAATPASDAVPAPIRRQAESTRAPSVSAE